MRISHVQIITGTCRPDHCLGRSVAVCLVIEGPGGPQH